MIGSVKRAITLLYCFNQDNSELSVSELSVKLCVHKSTISRLLATLASERLVNCNPENGKYRLGIGLIELSGYVVLHADLRQTAKPFLRQLSDKTKETVNLAVLEQDAAINIEQAMPFDRRVFSFGWVGRRTPLHASSTGKVLMAFLSEGQLALLLQEHLQRFTRKTITDNALLILELEHTRTQDYALGLEELEIGLNAVAAPIRNYNKEVIAAVSVTGPTSRLPKKRIEKELSFLVQDCAKNISLSMGYPPQEERI